MNLTLATAQTSDILFRKAVAALFNGLFLTGSKTYDPGSLADGASTSTTVTVTGATLGKAALATFSLDLAGVLPTAYVSAADTVTVYLTNHSGGVVDLGSGTLLAAVWAG